MARFIINDATKQDERARLTAEKLATISNIVAPDTRYLAASGANALQILGNCIVEVGGISTFKTGNGTLTAANLDSGGAFTVGVDYYVFVCDPGGTADEVYVISANSTYPAGYNATNSRKIGGFHYGIFRNAAANLQPINGSGVKFGTGWETNIGTGIVPRSVWTLQHRPKASPEGMVYLGGGTWVDIYLASDDGNGALRSAYNALPMTGSDASDQIGANGSPVGMTWYTFNEKAMASGKRLLTYAEFCQAALGSPQGNDADNNNAWSATANTGRKETGQVQNAVSSIGCRDCVGDVWEWLDELITNASGRTLMGTTTPTSYTYTDGGRNGQVVATGTKHGATTRGDGAAPVPGAWGWDAVSPSPGYGNVYEYYDQSLVALIAGGVWIHGVSAGARAVLLNNYPWGVNAGVGARCASDSL